MRIWILFFLFFFSTVDFAIEKPNIHPYHIGSVEIIYGIDSKTYQVTAKFFLDDLEDAINLNKKNSLFFDKPEQKRLIFESLEAYMKKHLVIKSNQKKVVLSFLGFEVEQESVYIYLESKVMESPNHVLVGLNVLYNLFDDQMNIVHLTVDGDRRSHKLDYPEIYFEERF